MKPPILLVGGGGHCKACIDVLEMENKYQIVGVVDQLDRIGGDVLGYPILGCDNDLPALIARYKNVLVSVGQIKTASVRMKLYNLCKSLDANLPVVVSPLAYVSHHAQLSEGTLIMHHALVNADAKIGVNCIINSKALIEHEATIGNHCHISTGAKINGQVSIGDECFIGSGATIINNINLTEKVIVPAGKIIFKNINNSGIYFQPQP